MTLERAPAFYNTGAAWSLRIAQPLNLTAGIAFQQASTISTTAGDLTLSPAGDTIVDHATANATFYVKRLAATANTTFLQATAGATILGNLAGVIRFLPGNAEAVRMGTSYLTLATAAPGTVATFNLVFAGGSTTPVIGAVTADIVQLAGVDFAAGDRRLYIQSELGSPTIIGNNAVRTGLAGTATGSFVMSGATSGVVTVTVAATAGTWTMTLPAAVGAAGQQLTDAAGDGITSWGAASLGEWKNDLGILDPHEALLAVVSAPTHRFTYKANVMPAGQWAPTDEMTGIFAEEAPWAMHGRRDGYRSGIAFSNVNAFGYVRAAVQGLYEDLQELAADDDALFRRIEGYVSRSPEAKDRLRSLIGVSG